jgi:diguanylate cyclase (GGDEF)-like protein
MMAVALYFMKRNYPPSIAGLGEWATAPAVLFVAAMLIGARGRIPDSLSIVVANLLLFFGVAMLYFGSQRFFGLRRSIRLWSMVILAVMLPVIWFALIRPHHGARVSVIAGFMTILAFIHARMILTRGPRTFSTFFTGFALLTLTAAQALRFAESFQLPASEDIFDNRSVGQGVYVAVYAFAILTTTIGMILMATDRLRGELEHLATHDSLTGALNRRALIEACALELARCRRNQQVMSVLLLDLDHFKAINDTHGHLVGDRVLVDFTERVRALLRLPDRLGRFGGEEFVVLLPETQLDKARLVAERIRADIEQADDELPRRTVSIGVTVSFPDDPDLDGLLTRADAALYRAKDGGRNRVETLALPVS